MLALDTRYTPAKATKSSKLVEFMPGVELPGFSMPFERDSEVFGEGEPADFAYKVISGVVRTLRVLDDGRRQISAFYFPGDIFGVEIGEEHANSAEAVTTVEIALVRQSALLKRTGENPAAACELWAQTSQELKRARSHLVLLGRQTACERVANFLLQMSGRQNNDESVSLPMSRTDIADYLGLTIETVSRTLSQMERKGAIALLNCKHIAIKRRDALECSEH
ncbi:MAG TPA: helix-turn-helix domain-containing protein [Alphaproteobacteria bacterium]|nr:helix-turn-helix domain-containing protein [Alphaproteobacteria bacterium]